MEKTKTVFLITGGAILIAMIGISTIILPLTPVQAAKVVFNYHEGGTCDSDGSNCATNFGASFNDDSSHRNTNCNNQRIGTDACIDNTHPKPAS